MSTFDETDLRRAACQEQFLDVVDRDTATARFHKHLRLEPIGNETVPLAGALNRVLAIDVIAAVDVPGFDRSNVDGFTVQAADTFGATEELARTVRLNQELLSPGVRPTVSVEPGTATTIATGAMIPRGANAVVMVEYTDLVPDDDAQMRTETGDRHPPDCDGIKRNAQSTGASPPFRKPSAGSSTPSSSAVTLKIMRSVSPGQNITFAGTDIARGETVLRAGCVLTSREIGVLAAIGVADVPVHRRPRVAIISTGDELIPPGAAAQPGSVYDSNSSIVAAAVWELGAEPLPLGIIVDNEAQLEAGLAEALRYDVVLLSGGTSKGTGDLAYRVVSRLSNPGIVAHGVALKPGKPICLAVTDGQPVMILPGFPTSAIFTFHEFVAPVIRALAGRPKTSKETVAARLPLRVNSERGRTEYLLVGLVQTDDGLAAYPMGKGSGSVTTFSCADGFITIGQQTEILDAGSDVEVQLLGQKLEPADLVAIGSHCVGLDFLLGELQKRGVAVKSLNVGSTGGLAAAKRGECDLAGIHLMDPETGEYNRPFLTAEIELMTGYRRMQGLVFRHGDVRWEGKSADEAIEAAVADPEAVMINRNAGSGTRILIDRLLGGRQPTGYAVQAKSHNAVAAAIAQRRADWGVAIETVSRMADLAFLPIQEEHFDFVIPKKRRHRAPVQLLRRLLEDAEIRRRLAELGF